MISPSPLLREYIKGFPSKKEACRHLDLAPDTLDRYLNGEQSCATAFIETVKTVIGWDFERAFIITEESKRGR